MTRLLHDLPRYWLYWSLNRPNYVTHLKKKDFLYSKCIVISLTITSQRVQRQLWCHQWWFLDWGLQQRHGSDLNHTRQELIGLIPHTTAILVSIFGLFKIISIERWNSLVVSFFWLLGDVAQLTFTSCDRGIEREKIERKIKNDTDMVKLLLSTYLLINSFP